MKKHAPRDDDSGRAMCGSTSKLVDAAFPDCKRCLRAIEARMRKEPNA